MTTELVFPGRVPMNNGAEGLLRMHHRTYATKLDAYFLHIRSLTRNQHKGQVKLELIRYGYGVEPDYDNLVSSGKLLLDACKKARVIVDDKPAIIAQRAYTFERVGKSPLQKTIIRFTDL